MICAEANPQVGVGHVMRCMALAQVWTANGGRCVFFGGIDAGSLRERLIAEGCELFESSPGPGDTARRLNDMGISKAWVVLDGYHFGPEWQDVLVDSGFAVLCIDDGARLPRYCAHVIVSPDCDARHTSYEAPPSTLILAGPRYRLLRQGMAGNTARPAIEAKQRVVLVAFGGADAGNVTLDVLKALDEILSPDDLAIVVLGPANRHRVVVDDALKAVAYRYELLQDVADMAAIYARADLAISAVGGAAWEMAASGLPAVLVPVAANQLPGASFLSDAGAALRVDDPMAITGKGFAAQVRDLLADRPRRAAMASAGRLICDGKGPHRVLGILSALEQGLEGNAFCLRRAAPDDMEQVFRLANDPDVRASSFSPARIALEDHASWFAARLASPDTAIFVLDLEGVVVAVVRYDRVAEEAEIDIAVHKAFRGRGLGVRILQASSSAAMRSLAVQQLRAFVLERNRASRNCFIKAGFREAGFEHFKGNECRVFIREAGQGKSDETA